MSILQQLSDVRFDTEEGCIRFLETVRWPKGVRCPQCGHGHVSQFQTKGKTGKTRHLYQCLEKSCRYQFSATTGTIFHDSHLPLQKWFEAMTLIGHSQELSVNQLRLALGVQYKTAAHVFRRVQQARSSGTIEMPEPLAVPASSRSLKDQASATDQLASRLAQSSTNSVRPSLAEASQTTRLAQASVGHPTPAAVPEEVGSATRPTTVDNMLNMLVSVAQMTVQPPLFFVNYLKGKVRT